MNTTVNFGSEEDFVNCMKNNDYELAALCLGNLINKDRSKAISAIEEYKFPEIAAVLEHLGDNGFSAGVYARLIKNGFLDEVVEATNDNPEMISLIIKSFCHLTDGCRKEYIRAVEAVNPIALILALFNLRETTGDELFVESFSKAIASKYNKVNKEVFYAIVHASGAYLEANIMAELDYSGIMYFVFRSSPTDMAQILTTMPSNFPIELVMTAVVAQDYAASCFYHMYYSERIQQDGVDGLHQIAELLKYCMSRQVRQFFDMLPRAEVNRFCKETGHTPGEYINNAIEDY